MNGEPLFMKSLWRKLFVIGFPLGQMWLHRHDSRRTLRSGETRSSSRISRTPRWIIDARYVSFAKRSSSILKGWGSDLSRARKNSVRRNQNRARWIAWFAARIFMLFPSALRCVTSFLDMRVHIAYAHLSCVRIISLPPSPLPPCVSLYSFRRS
jgi:hypothetical protein